MNIKSLLFLLVAVLAVSCTDLRESDKRRLVSAAQNGNIDAKQMVYRFQKSGSYGTFVDEQTYLEYEKELLEKGYYKVIIGKALDENENINAAYDDIKWAEFGAEHGCVPSMNTLAKYYHDQKTPESDEKAMHWTQMAADSSSALAKMRLLRWQDKSIYMPTRSIKVGVECWNETEGGNVITRFTNWTIGFVSCYVVDIFKFLFSSDWWQGLIGLILFIIVICGIYYVPSWTIEYVHPKAYLPMIWSMIYGAVNGFVMLIGDWGYIMSSDGWSKGDNYIAMNAGIFSHGPVNYSFTSDACVCASWIWLVGLIGILIYLLAKNAFTGLKPWKSILIVLFSIIAGYFYGAALSLLVVVIVVLIIVYLVPKMADGIETSSSSSSSSSSTPEPSPEEKEWDAEGEDEFGHKRKFKKVGDRRFIDDEGRPWKQAGTSEKELERAD